MYILILAFLENKKKGKPCLDRTKRYSNNKKKVRDSYKKTLTADQATVPTSESIKHPK